jgi:hypothetical protein
MMKGVKEMTSLLKQVAAEFPDRVAAAMYVEAQHIMTEAKRRCPVSPHGGTLRASGMVSEPERSGERISVTLSFGGAASDYAIAVHEHLSEHSPPSWVTAEEKGDGVHWSVSGTGPKFLEGPINEAMPSMAARLADKVRL